MARMSMVTIYDISKAAGVSPPTVSKALNGIGSISEKTKKRIIQAADDMGYERNVAARTLRTNKSGLIGIFNPAFYRHYDYTTPFFNTILSSFRESLEGSGYDFLLLPTLAKKQPGAPLGPANSRNLDGMVIITIGGEMQEYKNILAFKKPCVSVDEYFPNIPSIVTDNRDGARAAVRHLFDLGHKKIAFIGGPVSKISLASKERLQGYHDILDENRIRQDPALETRAGNWTAKEGYSACDELLKRKARFSALFAGNDYLALGAVRRLADAGIKVPGDVSVIGFDDCDGLEEYLTPSLSSVRQNAAQIGKTAADMLLRRLQGEKTEKRVLIPAELIPRESTCAFRGALGQPFTLPKTSPLVK
jgi:LacI family transcriptional regulator